MRSRLGAFAFLAVAAALLAGTSAAGGEAAGIEDLERRIRDLETRLAGPGGATDPAAAPRAPASDEGLFRVYWKDNLRLETADRQIQLRVGGRMQLDWAFADEDDEVTEAFGEQDGGVEFRRVRVDLRGLLYGSFEWRAEFDMAGGDADFTNVHVGMLGLPVVGNVRIGYFEQPISLEKINSNSYMTFMERGLPYALLPGVETGIMFHDRAFDGRLSWAAGVFRNTDSYGNGPNTESWNLTGRLTGLPLCRDDGRLLLHVGAGFSHQDPGEETLSYSSRPECHLVDTLIETGDMPVNSVETASVEAALVWGPLSLQGEYVYSWTREFRDADEDPEFQGYYVYAGFFLTGEHRPYDRSDGTFGRVRPRRNFALGEKAGPGAWELAVRYSHLDLDSDPVSGGKLSDLTAAVNWYLNPYARISFNYVFSDVEDVGDLNVFAVRFQVAF